MRTTTTIITFFLLCFITSSFSQTLTGTLKDRNGEKIDMASMLMTEAENPNQIKEFTTIKQGQFLYSLKKTYKNIRIEIKALGYHKHVETIEHVEKTNTYRLTFQLVKNDTTALEEVTITAKKSPIEVNGDTVSYHVSAYRNGSERKIEDIIKKLPGIEVNEKSGEIKYKGKPIETVNLDGDNLFGSNYSIGTKNINVDMVEQVQTIENYSENPLLKGVDSGDKVALNLKLKKGKYDFSGNIDAGAGIFDDTNPALLLNATLLGITTKLKSFSTIAYNNVGANNSPFDYGANNINASQREDRAFVATKLIPEIQASNIIENDRTTINQQLFSSLNNLFKISKKNTVRTNFLYLNDKIKSNSFFENQYQFNNAIFSTIDENAITKKPLIYGGEVLFKMNTSKSSLLEYSLKINQANSNVALQTIANQERFYTSDLLTDNFFLKQHLLYTLKILPQKVFQLSVNQSSNQLPQNLDITQKTIGSEQRWASQSSAFSKKYGKLNLSLIGVLHQTRYHIEVGGLFNNNPFTSALDGNSLGFQNSQNHNTYQQKSLYFRSSFQTQKKAMRLSYGCAIAYLGQELLDTNNTKSTDNRLVFEPFIGLRYQLNSYSTLVAKANYQQKPNIEQYMFYHPVLINNRNTLRNTPDLRLQSSQNYSLMYYNNDLYNQLQVSAGVYYQIAWGQFFSKFNITPFITEVEYFFLPQKNSSLNTSFNISKFISGVSSTLKLNVTYSSNQYFNVVNNSELRTNQSALFSTDFTWKTTFNIPINFENRVQYQHLWAKSQNQDSFDNKALQYTFRTFYHLLPSLLFTFSADYYMPNTQNKNNTYLFLDSSLRYTPKQKPWAISIDVKNMTNQDRFEQIQTSDIATSIYRTNILPRYFIVGLSYKL